MIAYLESEDAAHPTCIRSKNEAGDGEPTGRITSSIRHGEIFLRPEGDPTTWLRLVWSPKNEDRERSLPPGTYVVTGYRQLRAGEDETLWIWSSSSAGYRRIEVKTDETVQLDVHESLRVTTRATFNRGQHRVGLAFEAEKKLGHSLYRDGKRIGIRWQCLGGHIGACLATRLSLSPLFNR